MGAGFQRWWRGERDVRSLGARYLRECDAWLLHQSRLLAHHIGSTTPKDMIRVRQLIQATIDCERECRKSHAGNILDALSAHRLRHIGVST